MLHLVLPLYVLSVFCRWAALYTIVIRLLNTRCTSWKMAGAIIFGFAILSYAMNAVAFAMVSAV